MSKIYDEEDLVSAIKDFMQLNLAAKIAEINSEKSDFQIDNVSDFILAGDVLDLPNHIFCQVAIDGDIQIKNNGDDSAAILTVFVEVAFDNPKNSTTYRKSLRYMRAVYRTLLKFAQSAIEADGFEITKAVPMIVAYKQRQLVVSGAGLTVAIG